MQIVVLVIVVWVGLVIFQWMRRAMRRSPDPAARAAIQRFDAALDELGKAIGRLVQRILHSR